MPLSTTCWRLQHCASLLTALPPGDCPRCRIDTITSLLHVLPCIVAVVQGKVASNSDFASVLQRLMLHRPRDGCNIEFYLCLSVACRPLQTWQLYLSAAVLESQELAG